MTSKLQAYKAKLRRVNAAKLGMSLEEFDAYVARQQAEAAAQYAALYDRNHQWAVIASNAHSNNRTFTKLA